MKTAREIAEEIMHAARAGKLGEQSPQRTESLIAIAIESVRNDMIEAAACAANRSSHLAKDQMITAIRMLKTIPADFFAELESNLNIGEGTLKDLGCLHGNKRCLTCLENDFLKARLEEVTQERDHNLVLSGDISCFETEKPGCGYCNFCYQMQRDFAFEARDRRWWYFFAFVWEAIGALEKVRQVLTTVDKATAEIEQLHSTATDRVLVLERELAEARQHFDFSAAELDAENRGADRTAVALKKIADTGEKLGCFSGDNVEAAAQAIVALHKKTPQLLVRTYKLEPNPDPFCGVLASLANVLKDQKDVQLVLLSTHDLSAIVKVTYAKISFRTAEAAQEHENLCNSVKGMTLGASHSLARNYVVVATRVNE